ncbi:MAG TPA: hypothetical protein PLY93_11605, partial [Turneriella sp.]|nr:hypothetical protein [Turneriella sp.]
RVQKTIRIIQTCRGQIWSPDFYRSLASHPHIKIAAQDVYPDEPPLASDLLLSQFSTPHIAGYSTRGRLSGILRGVKALFDDIDGTKYFPQSHTWDFNRESENFQKQVNNFNTLRDTYPWRKEFHEYDAKERAELRVAFPQIKDNFFEHLFEPS